VHPTLSLEVGSFNILGKPSLYLATSFVHPAGYIFFFCLDLVIHSPNILLYSLDHLIHNPDLLIRSPDLVYSQSGPPYSQSGPLLSTVWTLFSNVGTVICKVSTTFYLSCTILCLTQYIRNLYKATLCFIGVHFIFKEDIYITKCTGRCSKPQ